MTPDLNEKNERWLHRCRPFDGWTLSPAGHELAPLPILLEVLRCIVDRLKRTTRGKRPTRRLIGTNTTGMGVRRYLRVGPISGSAYHLKTPFTRSVTAIRTCGSLFSPTRRAFTSAS